MVLWLHNFLHKKCHKKIFFCFLWIWTYSFSSFIFKSLSDIEDYALQSGHGVWKGQEFATLLSQVNEVRQKNGYQSLRVSVQKPIEGSRFIIFTDLCSSFHTLVRALKALQELEIIDGSLLIKDPKVYIVFNGNSVFSPIYALDTLTIILKLIATNPNNIIYLVQDEIKNIDWEQQPLVQELCARIKTKKSDEPFPLASPLRHFFSTLPLALYLAADSTGECLEFVRISADLKGQNLGTILSEPSLAVKINKSLPENLQKTCVRAIITKMDYSSDFAGQETLKLETQNDALIVWRTLTNSRGCNHSLSGFSSDSFIILNAGATLKDWSIQLFSYQNSVKQFVPLRMVNLLAGDELPWREKAEYDFKVACEKLKKLQEQVAMTKNELAELDLSIKSLPIENKKEATVVLPEKAVDKKNEFVTVASAQSTEHIEKKDGQEIVNIGSTMDLSRKYLNKLVNPTKEVMDAYFDIDMQDKLHKNRIVKMTILDDEFNPEKARTNILALKRDFKANIIMFAFGTLASVSYFDLIKDGSVLSLFPFVSSRPFLEKGLKNVVFFGLGKFTEEYWVTKHAIENLNAKKIAIFYLPAINRSLDGAKKALEEAKFRDYITVIHSLESVNFTEQVSQIKSFDPDILLLSSNYAAAITLLNELGASWLLGKKIVVTSALFTNVEIFDKYCADKGVKYLIASQVPNPKTSNLEVVKDFRNFANHYSISIGTVELYIYMCCRIFTEIVNKIEGPVTAEKVKKVAEQFKDYDLGGVKLTFNPNERNLVNSIWLNDCTDEWNDDWKRVDIKSDLYKPF